MKKAALKELISKYSRGESTESDREKLIQWYSNTNLHEADGFLDDLGDIIDEMEEKELFQLEERLSRMEAEERITRKTRLMSFVKIAAVFTVFLLSSFLVYRYFQDNAPNLLEYRTAIGEIREITLPDQSQIVLNAASVLKVPEKFSEDSREIMLEGEAFFDVERDESRPFRVKTATDILVTVLGTSFNINDYGDRGQVEVAVASGKVTVGKGRRVFGIITKNQQINYEKATGDYSQTLTDNPNSWVDGQLVFSEHSLEDVVNTLNRTFKKELKLDAEVDKGLLFKGNFDREQGIEAIVEILCILHDLKFEVRDNQILIKNKPRD